MICIDVFFKKYRHEMYEFKAVVKQVSFKIFEASSS
jgi:hypothetical protein